MEERPKARTLRCGIVNGEGRGWPLAATPVGSDRTIELIATVSHEIRSPLTTIKGFTKTLIDRWEVLGDPTKLEMLDAINEDADRVTRLLTELLDISRLEAGKMCLHYQLVDLRELAREVVEKLGRRSAAHEVELASGDPVEVRVDPDKLRQVLANFVENALKYTDGGIVSVECSANGTSAEVRVTDCGEGVHSDLAPSLFEKFARQDVPGSPTGTGLGLFICKGLIEAHAGEIGVDPAPTGGSSFWFRVPTRSM